MSCFLFVCFFCCFQILMVVDSHALPYYPGAYFYNLHIIYASVMAYEMCSH